MPDCTVCTTRAGRIDDKEYAYLFSELAIEGLVTEINKIVVALGGFKGSETVKWYAPPSLACMAPRSLTRVCTRPQVPPRPESPAVGLRKD